MINSMEKNNNLSTLLSIMEELNYVPGQKTLMTMLDYGKRKSLVSIEDKAFKDYLKYEFLERFGTSVSDQEIKDAISISRHSYKVENDMETEFAVRVYQDKSENKLYYDLANSKMEYVVIDTEGNVSIEQMNFEANTKFVFVRGNYTKPQIKPVKTKSNILDTLNYLDDFLNLSDDEKFLYKIWLVASLCPEIRTPIPYFIGEAGTGKSSMITILNDFIDPSENPLRNWDASSNRDLAIDFKYAWNCNSDNISKITQRRSDLLCQTVTGGSMTFRQLFEDDKQMSFDLRRRVTMSSIRRIKLSPDLAQRVLFFYPKRINYKTRISEDAFSIAYQEHKGEILYTIFRILGCAMAIFNEYKESHHTNYRLSSFYLFGELVAYIIDPQNGTERFRKIMKNQIREQLHWNSDDDRKFYEVLFYYVQESGNEYDGSIRELYDCLYLLVTEDYGCPIDDIKVVPQYSSFSKTIHNYEDNMSMLGYKLEFHQEGRNKTAMVRIMPLEED